MPWRQQQVGELDIRRCRLRLRAGGGGGDLLVEDSALGAEVVQGYEEGEECVQDRGCGRRC